MKYDDIDTVYLFKPVDKPVIASSIEFFKKALENLEARINKLEQSVSQK